MGIIVLQNYAVPENAVKARNYENICERKENYDVQKRRKRQTHHTGITNAESDVGIMM